MGCEYLPQCQSPEAGINCSRKCVLLIIEFNVLKHLCLLLVELVSDKEIHFQEGDVWNNALWTDATS